MSARWSRRLFPLTLGLALVPAVTRPSCAEGQETEGAEKVAAQGPPRWMVPFEASNGYTIGLDEAALDDFVHKTLKSKWAKDKDTKSAYEQIRLTSMLLQTPAQKVDVPAFALSKWEVTNAQWAKYLEFRQADRVTKAGETLEQLGTELWRIDPNVAGAGVGIKKAWLTLLARNADVLMPILNPPAPPEKDKDGKEKPPKKWDPVLARASEVKLPEGLTLKYWLIAPRLYWNDDGTVPETQRLQPVHNLSWEEADDFARWAGFHLPTEPEWERAARGAEGRLFAWGNDWDPLKFVWRDYNRSAKDAKVAGMEDAPSATPGPVDVTDPRFAVGDTPEGLRHMMGNVYEYTLARLHKYEGTKAKNDFTSGLTPVARGGSWYDDKPELLLASDRNWETHGGAALLASHAVDSYGMRLAWYPVPGADLTAAIAQRYNGDWGRTEGPHAWLPPAAGFGDRMKDKKGDAFIGFDAMRTAGWIARNVVDESPDHVFVTGPASGIALLPIRAVAGEHVSKKGDFEKLLANRDRMVVIGVLTGTEQSGFELLTGEGDAATSVTVRFDDRRLIYDAGDRVVAMERIGALLALETADDTSPPDVVVYSAALGHVTLRGAARHRLGRLGKLRMPATVEWMKGPAPASSAVLKDSDATLTVSIPILDPKGKPKENHLRVTITVPFVRQAK